MTFDFGIGRRVDFERLAFGVDILELVSVCTLNIDVAV